MSGGAARDGSLSPVVEETYQSPGASQEEGIDVLLAQYSSLGQDGEGGGEGGGGVPRSRSKDAPLAERSPHSGRRGHPPPGTSRSSQQPVTSSASPHHTSTPTASQHTTPAHSSADHAPQPARHPGLGGDVRSFSWDNLPTESAGESEGGRRVIL